MITRILPRCLRRLSTAPLAKKTPKEDDPIMVVPRSDEGVERSKKRIVVTLLGANNQTAHITAVCLKLKCNDLRELRMWDLQGSLRGVAMELSHIPTSPRVLPFIGRGQLQMALRNADVVMIMGGNTGFPLESTSDLFSRNIIYMRDMTNVVITHASKAFIGICVNPLMPNLAFFSKMQIKQGVFCPNKVFGVVSLDEMRASTLAAVKLGLPPGTVKVQLTGGATSDTVVPVVSSAHPGGDFLEGDLVEVMNLMRGMTENLRDIASKGPYITGGHATANFIMSLAKAICSDRTVNLSSAVRTSALFGVPYLTLPVTIGQTGVIGTTGIPRLTNMELKALIRVLPTIVEHISMGESMATLRDSMDDDLLDLYR